MQGMRQKLAQNEEKKTGGERRQSESCILGKNRNKNKEQDKNKVKERGEGGGKGGEEGTK